MGPSSLAAQDKDAEPAKATATLPASSAEVIALPDGKPVQTRLTKDLSTATAKVGDDLELSVAETVRHDGLVILPKGALLTAKITAVRHAGRRSRNGNVSFSVESAAFPGGQTAALRPQPAATGGQNFREGIKAVGQLAVDPELPPGFGLLLLPVGGPLVLFGKGHERTIYASQVTTLYVHGPLSLNREAVLQMQPPPYKGPSQVFYKNRAYIKDGDLHATFYCGRKNLGVIIANQILVFELNPGTYWLSTGKDGAEQLRLEVEAHHQYYIERGVKGLVLKSFDDNPGLLDHGPWPNEVDFTSASPGVAADLVAVPEPDKTVPNNP